MGTSYCDRYTYFQIYGHYPPEDGTIDPALASGTEAVSEVVAKVVTPNEASRSSMQTSDVAETKTVEPEDAEPEQE